jgi:predicted nucleic acid-binding protein
LLANEQIVAPDVAVYEVANAVWKRENLLKNLKNGLQYIAIFFGFIESGKIAVLPLNENLSQESYKIAERGGITLYDAVFVALALELGLPLKTFDKAQIRAFKSESHNKTL